MLSGSPARGELVRGELVCTRRKPEGTRRKEPEGVGGLSPYLKAAMNPAKFLD